MEMMLAYITCRDRSEADSISKHLLNKRLIACSNIFPIESMYWWNDSITEDKEFVIIAKTLKERFDDVRTAVKKVHSYEIPCILGIEVKANEEFMEWVRKELSP